MQRRDAFGYGGVTHKSTVASTVLCAVKAVEGNFRFCWTISPNVGQTHKENPNLVRFFFIDETGPALTILYLYYWCEKKMFKDERYAREKKVRNYFRY